MLYEYLSRMGYKALTAPGGKEAVEIIAQEKPDLVLMDLAMRGMNGIEVLKDLNRRGLKAKVVILTGADSVELEKEARANGAAGFLRKQLELPLIAKTVDAMLKEGAQLASEQIKVLVVDDNEQIRTLLDSFLRKKGFLPLLAPNGEEALEVIRRAHPRIILLDINLPGMDGLMTLKKIREFDQDTGVIMITGVQEESAAEEAVRLGAYDYIVKPFDLEYLEICLLTKITLVTS
jgi:DNA-binding response OmpR family regulator